MTRRLVGVLGLAFLVLLAVAAGRGAGSPPPEDVARAWGQALYAQDADGMWRLLSSADRRVKSREALARQVHPVGGFTGQAVRQLAQWITAVPVATRVNGDRATVTLRFRLPDANAPAVRDLLLEWDEDRLNATGEAERARIFTALRELHAAGRLPTIDGDETIALRREAGRWTVFLDWAGGVRVAFHAAVAPDTPLRVTVTPAEAVLAPGERLRVTLRAENVGGREVSVRVGHLVEPAKAADQLALLLCPLFVPVTLGPHEAETYTSEYLLLATVPPDVRAFDVTYRFPGEAPGARTARAR
jgi:hypothetical protein